jgi:hypothetical protein
MPEFFVNPIVEYRNKLMKGTKPNHKAKPLIKE